MQRERSLVRLPSKSLTPHKNCASIMTERKQSLKMAQYPMDESAHIRKGSRCLGKEAPFKHRASQDSRQSHGINWVGRLRGRKAERSVVNLMKMKQHGLRQKNSSQLCQFLFTKPSTESDAFE